MYRPIDKYRLAPVWTVIGSQRVAIGGDCNIVKNGEVVAVIKEATPSQYEQLFRAGVKGIINGDEEE